MKNKRKSSYSGGSGGDCVRVGELETGVGVEDTKARGEGPVIPFTPQAWSDFTDRIRSGNI